jgi:hypothetical protein
VSSIWGWIPPEVGGPLPITASRMGHLWDALSSAYNVLGFDAAAGGDEVFRWLVLARIIEPTSKLDSLRVLREAGIGPVSYPTLKRRLAVLHQAVAGAARCRMRPPRRVGTGDLCALRRDDPVLRDRCR